MAFSYLLFDLVFLAVPVAVLAALIPADRRRYAAASIALVSAVTVVYAAPWDNYVVSQGVWTYGAGSVVARLPYTPLGEYLFFVLQPALVGTWYYRDPPDVVADVGVGPFPTRPVMGALWFAVALAGGALLTLPSLAGGGYYLGALLLWVAPVIALEWVFGGPALWRYRGPLLSAVAATTAYLWVVDWVALETSVWSVPAAHSLGVAVAGVPVEELAFFLLTNTLVVSAYVLFDWVVARSHASDEAGPLA